MAARSRYWLTRAKPTEKTEQMLASTTIGDKTGQPVDNDRKLGYNGCGASGRSFAVEENSCDGSIRLEACFWGWQCSWVAQRVAE
jgi:hypothetical protein